MALIQKLARLDALKFSFAKNTEFALFFANDVGACSMYQPGFGLSIPVDLLPEYQLRGIFTEVLRQNGIFLFNISGVDLNAARKGFVNFDEADHNNQITEWELHQLLANRDYLKRTIFHNGRTEFKKQWLWKAVKS